MTPPGHIAYRTLINRAESWSAARLRAAGPWLVLAPHPDDESLGCGAMLSRLAAQGAAAHVAFLTDGAGSHEGSPTWSARRLAVARRIEAEHALRALGGARPLWLGWPDAAPPGPGTPAYTRTLSRLAAYCRRHRIRALAVSWGGEAHCDHEAAAGLACALQAQLGAALRLFDYLVWGWTDPRLAPKMAGRRIVSIGADRRHRARQHRATLCHRTQTGTRIADAPQAFRLPRAMIALSRRPRILLLPHGGDHAA